MSNPNITLSIASALNITNPPVRTKVVRISEWYSSQSEGCNSFWREASLVVPSALLVLYLGFQARRNVKKLRHRKSYVMIAYYALLWLSALLNLAWAFLQGWQCAPEIFILSAQESSFRLSRLEVIYLFNLEAFKGVIDTPAPAPPQCVFLSLKKLDIYKVSGFPNLEEISIEWCEEIEDIFEDEGRGESVTLPKLTSLRLFMLPRLESMQLH